jgi:type VI secretion system protein ImpE
MASPAREHFSAGKLAEALAAATAEVRSKPTDVDTRIFLAELLCMNGDLDRADKQLDVIVDQDSSLAIGVALFRQLIRGEQARRQFYAEGRVPEFLDQPPARLQLHLQASIALREKDQAEALRLLTEAEESRPEMRGECDGKPFDDLRDLDDLTAGVFEVVTSTGKFYWIPVEKVETIEFKAPQRTRDLIWRQASMSVRGGPEGEVYLPVCYAHVADGADDAAKLGRSTDWIGGDGAPVLGRGLRTFLVGEQDRTILEIGTLRFPEPA